MNGSARVTKRLSVLGRASYFFSMHSMSTASILVERTEEKGLSGALQRCDGARDYIRFTAKERYRRFVRLFNGAMCCFTYACKQQLMCCSR